MVSPQPIQPSGPGDLDPIPESPVSDPRHIHTEDLPSDATDYEDVDSQGLRASIIRDRESTKRNSNISNGSVVQNGRSAVTRSDSSDDATRHSDLLRSGPPRTRDTSAHLSTTSLDSEGQPIYSRPDLMKKLSRRSTEVKERGVRDDVTISTIASEPRTPDLPPRPDNLLDTSIASAEQNPS